MIPGVAATLFANVCSGLPHGHLAATVAAWPAIAFSVASFMLERWLKSQARRGGQIGQEAAGLVPSVTLNDVTAPIAVSAVPRPYLNGSGLHPDEAGPFAGELARGEVPSIRRIRSELHVGQPRAQEIRARLAALARTP